jgi:hypothetical protein
MLNLLHYPRTASDERRNLQTSGHSRKIGGAVKKGLVPSLSLLEKGSCGLCPAALVVLQLPRAQLCALQEQVASTQGPREQDWNTELRGKNAARLARPYRCELLRACAFECTFTRTLLQAV